MTKSKANVYIVHGYTASSQAEWFPWLKDKLIEIGTTVTVFDMPNPNAPVPMEWDAYLENNIAECGESTFFVGHSLGCIALLRYLEKQAVTTKIGGVILVSGFLEPVPTLPMLDSFLKQDLNTPKLIKMVEKRLVISSPKDWIVDYQYSSKLAKQMKARLITVESGGHFIAQEGFTEFPLVYDELCKMINNSQ